MNLYVLRHGESTANVRRLVCGASDYALSDVGTAQAKLAGKQLKHIQFDAIYSSPLTRATKTVELMARDEPIELQPALQELNTGEVSHITLQELWNIDERFKQPWLHPNLRYPAGETFSEMVSRISRWLDYHLPLWDKFSNVLVVGHEGTLRTLYLRLMELDLSNYPDFSINNCDHFLFQIDNRTLSRFHHVRHET